MKKSLLLFVVFCLLFSAMAVSADCNNCNDTASQACDPCTEECKHRVYYTAGNCGFDVLPLDCEEHAYGECVTVKWDPIQYKNGLIFYGWDRDGDGIVDNGYENDSFYMPNKDVTLRAVCIPQWPVTAPAAPACHGCVTCCW